MTYKPKVLKPNFKRKFDYRKWTNQDAIKEMNRNVRLIDWDKLLEEHKGFMANYEKRICDE